MSVNILLPPTQEMFEGLPAMTVANKLTSLQRRDAELVVRDRIRKLLCQFGKLDTIQGLGRVLASSNVLLDGRWEICPILRAKSI